MHACVIGAGIVGLATAYTLHQCGARVTVIDQAQRVASGASGGNGAQLSYSYVQPLADPSLWRQLPKLLLQADSPLRFRLQADWRQWFWAAQFLAACRSTRARQTTAALLELAAQSRQAFDAMLATTGIACDYAQPGKLVLLASAQALAAARHQQQLQAALGGAPQQVLSPAAAMAIEPALADYASQFAGAIHTPSEAVADPRKLCEGLACWLQTQGVAIQLGTAADALRTDGAAVRAVRTPAGDVQADVFVVCAGWTSAALLASVGDALPVYPLKGYSITLDLPLPQQAAAPRVSITDARRKVVFARIGARLRVAGVVELVGADQTLDTKRIEGLRAATATVFPALAPALAAPTAAWTGMRPATPTGLPVLRRINNQRNAWLNTGHGALGLTLAFGSATRLAKAIGIDA